jgi:predicted RecB family nuclease
MTSYITKSRVLSGLRCPKRLWLQNFQPKLANPSPTSELTIANGIEIGKMARLNYPDGILIEHIEYPDVAVAETKRLIANYSRVPLLEAAFVYAGALVRADILVPVDGGWRVIEVKSSGSIKDHHLIDCAVQLWVLEGAGVKVQQVCLAHVDTSFVYAGDGNYDQLLVAEDVTEKVRALLPDVPAWSVSHRDILANAIPLVRMGSQCKPDCQFKDHCEQELPEYPVSILPNGRKVITDLQEVGIEDVRDIPDGVLTKERHITVWQATCANQPYISPALKTEFDKLPYPRFYLDFETINFVIPRWAGTRPHQQLPFQWSCHIQRKGGILEHREFLDTSGNAPMRAFAESLIAVVEADGPIIVYGTFESTVIKGLIGFFADLEKPLSDILDRLVNLLPWLQNHYYHPAMKGSWSIKAVLPTLAPHLDYSQLDAVQNGTMAQLAFLDIINPEMDERDRKKKIQNLLKYCELDTQAMVEVVRSFIRCSNPDLN